MIGIVRIYWKCYAWQLRKRFKKVYNRICLPTTVDISLGASWIINYTATHNVVRDGTYTATQRVVRDGLRDYMKEMSPKCDPDGLSYVR